MEPNAVSLLGDLEAGRLLITLGFAKQAESTAVAPSEAIAKFTPERS